MSSGIHLQAGAKSYIPKWYMLHGYETYLIDIASSFEQSLSNAYIAMHRCSMQGNVLYSCIYVYGRMLHQGMDYVLVPLVACHPQRCISMLISKIHVTSYSKDNQVTVSIRVSVNITVVCPIKGAAI